VICWAKGDSKLARSCKCGCVAFVSQFVLGGCNNKLLLGLQLASI